jgi:hypothetical protein
LPHPFTAQTQDSEKPHLKKLFRKSLFIKAYFKRPIGIRKFIHAPRLSESGPFTKGVS